MNSPSFSLIASFVAFTDAESMEKAATKLGISQPALTSHLKQFEQHFPQPVFEFKGRRKILTAFGEELKNLFQNRFANLEKDLEMVIEKTLDPKQVSIKIAARHEILYLLAPKISFTGNLHFMPIPSEDGVSGLLSHQYDFAITYSLGDSSELHAKKLFKYDYSLIYPKKWALENNKLSRVFLEKILAFPFISHRANSENFRTLAKKFNLAEQPLYKKIIPDWDAIMNLVENEEGWSIVPTHFVPTYPKTTAIQIPKNIIEEVQFYLVYRAETSKRFWFKDFYELLKKCFIL